jgi:hypothetical protein
MNLVFLCCIYVKGNLGKNSLSWDLISLCDSNVFMGRYPTWYGKGRNPSTYKSYLILWMHSYEIKFHVMLCWLWFNNQGQSWVIIMLYKWMPRDIDMCEDIMLLDIKRIECYISFQWSPYLYWCPRL